MAKALEPSLRVILEARRREGSSYLLRNDLIVDREGMPGGKHRRLGWERVKLFKGQLRFSRVDGILFVVFFLRLDDVHR